MGTALLHSPTRCTRLCVIAAATSFRACWRGSRSRLASRAWGRPSARTASWSPATILKSSACARLWGASSIKKMTGFRAEMRQRFLDKRILRDDGAKGRQILQRDAKKPFLILTGMAGLALLIACANVANLLLARGAARRREIAVRMALGAGRWRLMRQFLLESLLLSLMGGVVGLIVAVWTIHGLVAAIPPSVGALGLSTELDPRLLGFTLALSALIFLTPRRKTSGESLFMREPIRTSPPSRRRCDAKSRGATTTCRFTI